MRSLFSFSVLLTGCAALYGPTFRRAAVSLVPAEILKDTGRLGWACRIRLIGRALELAENRPGQELSFPSITLV